MVLLQSILGKLYPISLFVTLCVLFSLFPSYRLWQPRYLSHREGRAMLAGETNRTHFQTGASLGVMAPWSVRPGEPDPTDSKSPSFPVRSPWRKKKELSDWRFLYFFLVLFSWSSRSSQATQVPKEVVHLTRKQRNNGRCDRVGMCMFRNVSVMIQRLAFSRLGGLRLQWRLLPRFWVLVFCVAVSQYTILDIYIKKHVFYASVAYCDGCKVKKLS